MKYEISSEQTGQELTGQTILPCISELFIDKRKGKYLILNPLGPWWFIGSKLHADFVRLCDGKRSLQEIRESMTGHGEITEDQIFLLVQLLQKANFFTPTGKLQIRPLSTVFFTITKNCNLRCPYCNHEKVTLKSEPGEAELDAEMWIELAGKIAEINPLAKLMISGGEPLLRPDVFSIIEQIVARYNLEIKLMTNGTLFNQDIIKRLSTIKNLNIQIGIDSVIPEVNEKTRGLGSLKKSLTAVRQLKAAGIPFEISSIITRQNISTIRQFREYCRQNEYKLRPSIFMPSGDLSKANYDWLGLDPQEYLDACTYALESFEPGTTMGHPIAPGLCRYGCGIGYAQMDIGPDGSVYPCSHLTESSFCMGNIRTSTLHQLIAEGQHRYGACEIGNASYCTANRCPVRYFCAGGCPANTYHHDGSMDAPPKYCEQLKQSYINALWVYMLGTAYLKSDPEPDNGE